MATQKATNYTKAYTPTSDNVLAPGTLGGRVRVHTDDFTFAGEAIGEIIQVGRAFADGAIILGVTLQNAALGGSVTVRVGDANDDDRYMTDIDVSSAATTTTINIAGSQYTVGTNDDDNLIQILTAGAAATGQFKITVYYTED